MVELSENIIYQIRLLVGYFRRIISHYANGFFGGYDFSFIFVLKKIMFNSLYTFFDR